MSNYLEAAAERQEKWLVNYHQQVKCLPLDMANKFLVEQPMQVISGKVVKLGYREATEAEVVKYHEFATKSNLKLIETEADIALARAPAVVIREVEGKRSGGKSKGE